MHSMPERNTGTQSTMKFATINGKPIDEILAAQRSVISHDNESGLSYSSTSCSVALYILRKLGISDGNGTAMGFAAGRDLVVD